MSGPETSSDYFPVHRNISGYYAFQLFFNMSFWLAIYAVFFLDKGLHYSEILIVYALLNGTQTILEIPSGALADRWGRRSVLILGAFLQTIGNLLIAFGGSLPFYMIGMAANGAALAFISGSDSAFIYDTLKISGWEKDYKKIESRAYMYNLFGWAGAGLLGGFLAEQNLAIPFVVTAIASILALLVMATCSEPPRLQDKTKPIEHNLRQLVISAGRIVVSNKLILSAVVLNGIVIGTLLINHKFSQPYLLASKIDLKFFGIIYFVWLMSAALSSFYSSRIEKLLGTNKYLLSLPLAAGLVMLYLGWLQNWAGVVLIILHQYAWGSLRPFVTNVVNREVESNIRATVLSIVGFGASLVYILGVPVIGLIADKSGFTVAFTWLGIIILLLGLPAAFWLYTKTRIPAGET